MIRKVLIKILRRLYFPILTGVNKPEYIKQIERAYHAGYNYHQKLMERDPELLNWITRENYFDN